MELPQAQQLRSVCRAVHTTSTDRMHFLLALQAGVHAMRILTVELSWGLEKPRNANDKERAFAFLSMSVVLNIPAFSNFFRLGGGPYTPEP
jgi:hypothetical protein